MARRFEAQLKPCPYCGGKAKLKYEKKHTSFNTGTNHSNRRNVKFIRCERCHAHTISFSYELNLLNAWNQGAIYRS